MSAFSVVGFFWGAFLQFSGGLACRRCVVPPLGGGFSGVAEIFFCIPEAFSVFTETFSVVTEAFSVFTEAFSVFTEIFSGESGGISGGGAGATSSVSALSEATKN
jgi:hypothetical protein